ncbi:hypothetical protein KIW84_032836 [Lathyrus oleraceus]|uniref:Uncharacterized protein n=1 Tax=Pisum sativum TaxID=3888 RepID=A0A9D5B2A3_PEA|nr:hypothetical protein KIW84_032836 [Pisum sativum]
MERDEDTRKKLLHKDEEEELSLMKRIWKECKLMWVVAGPAIFTRFSTFGIQIISQAFVGHIGSKELAAFSLVFTVLVRFVNAMGYQPVAKADLERIIATLTALTEHMENSTNHVNNANNNGKQQRDRGKHVMVPRGINNHLDVIDEILSSEEEEPYKE